MIIELFPLDVTVEALRANIDWKSTFLLQQGQFGPQCQVELVAPNHSSCQKSRKNDLSCGIRKGTSFFRLLSHSTRLTDGRTDGQKGLDNTVRCITCSRTVKANASVEHVFMRSHGAGLSNKMLLSDLVFFKYNMNMLKHLSL